MEKQPDAQVIELGNADEVDDNEDHSIHGEDKHDDTGAKDEGIAGKHRGRLTTSGNHMHDKGLNGASTTHDSAENLTMHGKHTLHDEDAGVTHESFEKLAAHGKHAHNDEDGAMNHEPRERSTTHGKHTHDDEHAGLTHEPRERSTTHGKDTHDHEDVGGMTHEPSERLTTHAKFTCDDEDVGMTHELKESSTTHGKHMHDDEVAGVTHEPGERSITYEKHTHDDDVDMTHVPREISTTQGKHMHDEKYSGMAHEHGEKHGKCRDGVENAGMTGEHGEKYMSVEDECESKKTFSDENSSRERVHFSGRSTPDMDTPTQRARSPFNTTKSSRSDLKAVGNADRGPGSVDGNLETPSTSWAFSARASIAPSKFDHMATLRMTYSAYKESNKGKEGVPLSLVYEMMKEIDNHRRKSAKEGNYLAADAAAQRLLELKLFEDNKRRATMLERHAQEREQAEKAYKEELQERNQLWDERLKNFQKEVVDHAQRLKQQHIAALQHFKEKMASKTPVKAQWSRELLKQRRIQVYLGKQGKYLEAQEVKQSADRMEQAELQAAIAAFQAEVIGKEQTVRLKQQTEMDILLQRAARTREEIRKSRTLDLQRCHQRHKNVMRELAAIQKQEVFRFDQLMQKKVQNPYTGVGFGGQRLPQSPSSRSQLNAPDYSTDDAFYSGGEEDNLLKN